MSVVGGFWRVISGNRRKIKITHEDGKVIEARSLNGIWSRKFIRLFSLVNKDMKKAICVHLCYTKLCGLPLAP